MAKAVADTNAAGNQGGFAFENHSLVTGFSTLHDSGTGSSPSLGNFALFPHASCKDDDINGCAFPKKARAKAFNPASVKAEPGYFSIALGGQSEVKDIPGSPLILMDLTDLHDSRQDNATIEVDGYGRMKGSGVFSPSFGSGLYKAFFCADFRPSSGTTIRDYGIFVDSRATRDVNHLKISRGINGYPLPGGAWYRFAPGKDSHVLVRVATSFISSEQACRHAEHEIPHFAIETVRHDAAAEWRKKMAPIRVSRKGIDKSILTNFYSGIYRTMINPQDYTGENPMWRDFEPLWDTFRSQMPFLTIFDPAAVTEMIRSLINTQKHLGWLPDCRMSLCKGFTQGGSNADNVIADAFVKGLQGIDWQAAYEAVKKDADVEPYDWSVEGRGGLESWEKVNYIPVQDLDHKGFGTMTRSISRTLEYAYNDFAIAQMAKGLGKAIDLKRFLRSSEYWENLFKVDQVSTMKGKNTGFIGFFQPRYLNGTWGHQVREKAP
ncbi:hypothetical protein KEM54_000780 [Ascosphaera aggregata]|nr:hypothetical protein KEM54_000780 [Ascosphaera aggregata]